MFSYSVQERVKIVEFYYISGRSIVTTQRKYRQHFNTTVAPSVNMIRSLMSRFENLGSVGDELRRNVVSPVRTKQAVEAVRESVHTDPTVSTRRRATQLGISRTSLRRILKVDLMMFPYKIQLAQKLLPRDEPQRLQYANRLILLSTENPKFLNNLIMSDEAHFHLNGFVNKQNCRIWGTENPRALHQRQLHPVRCTVWCGIMADKVIGPYFFENEIHEPQTVSGAAYRTMLEDFLRPVVLNNRDTWFQQDGATAHTARATIAILRELFDDRIISKNADFAWPPRSPDLTAPDFFCGVS